ncbi:BTAD domain-containing putative transcriptional regulator [Marinitenerispora sediminis]|uniref:Protein kinase n=1 Tax=Marinitenerispora sediminis TaxID=1931232 RepID=A0A368SZ19_9ACTN|nr:BTAD domain-containing putative transcriptional regulator [Marinitenerispora sediminis]RCV49573.1 protein kinase [Marinitenerispora sediminis]RCV50275.1 protein kinase [Marinitenerispora sediminis]RCV53145.1 protein kinase [Marinitenerispora sediminis]
MRFGILGPVDVRLADGSPLAVGGPRVRALLALLLLDAGRPVGTDRLLDGLYGAEPPAAAANALQSQVSRLRRALRPVSGGRELVERLPGGYRIAVAPEDVDAHRFERLAARGRHALASGDPRRAAALLREALALWRGPALADLAGMAGTASGAPHVDAHAARLAELRLATVEDRVEADLALEPHGALVAELRELVAAHPLRERPAAQLVRALHARGRRAEALAVYREARRRLVDELGIEPSAELAAAQLAVLRAEPAPAPPAPRRSVLPAQLTSFVGRDTELERVVALLETARLVTLTGPGGSGKTRLAVEAAARRPVDVCFVELGRVESPDVVPQAVAAALGLRDAALLPPLVTGGPPPPADAAERLAAALAERRLLLVLDNCEHVVVAAARLAGRLLGTCPALRVLATSREPLGITGETLCPVPPLALPPPGVPAAEAPRFPAVRLFAERAAAVRPGFTVNGGSAEAVLHICRALDGLPLAIELAAARLRSLPVGEVAARLDDRFQLLSRGSRTAEPRHRTLRAVVEWSWDLLDDAERRLARRLTVFAGGATVEQAARVCGVSEAEAVDLLTGLADKSLVEAAGDDPQRFRMLATVRAFCAERLADAGEVERTRRAHALYHRGRVLAAAPRLRGSGQLEWLRRLDAEHDDILAALRWAVRAGEREFALEMLAALTSYWWLRGRRVEGAAVARDLLKDLAAEPPAGLEEEYALCALVAATAPSDLLPDRAVDEERLAGGLSGPLRHPFLLVLWGRFAGVPGERGPRMIALERFATDRDPWVQALVRTGLAYRRLAEGRVAESEREFAAGLEGFRSVGERWGMAIALSELGTLAAWRGDWAAASAMAAEALELFGALDAAEDMADVLCQRAAGRLRAGDLAGARSDGERAAELARRAGSPEQLALAHLGLGEVARQHGDLAGARLRFETALRDCPTGWFSAEDARTRLHIALGRIAELEGDAARARDHHGAVLAALAPTGPLAGPNALLVAPTAVEALAGVALLRGDGRQAARLLGTGRVLRGCAVAADPDVGRVTAAARALVGDTAFEHAHRTAAELTREQALAVLAELTARHGA